MNKPEFAPAAADVSFDDPDFFLSKINPAATADQRDLEALALEVMQMPEVLQAKELVRKRYKTISGRDVSAEAWARFDKVSAEEEPFNYVLKAVTSDANYPKVLGNFYLPAHEWLGMKIPGSRCGGGDGPDTHYSLIPIDPYARFELHGKRMQPAAADGSYWIIGNAAISMTMNHLDQSNVQLGPDGRYVITVDPEPANGRPNHLQTEPDARYLFIRNNRSDWKQVPDAYRVRRIDPPLAAPLTKLQIANRAARTMLDDVASYVMWANYFVALEPNKITGDFTSTIGGMSTQRNAMARLRLADDEAFVFTLSGGMPFRSVSIFDYWFNTFDYWNHTVCLNNAQTADNPDGSATYVVSLQDPGVHNWLDPVGYYEPRLFVRFQNPRWTQETLPWAKGQLVKLKDLDSVLPSGTRRVSAAERQQQLADRLVDYNFRFVT